MGPVLGWLPRTRRGLVGLSLATAGIVVAGRFLAGLLLGMPARRITYVSIVGGAVAAMIVVATIERWATIPESEEPLFRAIQLAHVVYLTVMGGLYPTVFGAVLGLSRGWYAAFPGAVLTGIVWSELLFVVAGVAYLLTGAVPATRDTLDIWLNLFWVFFLYGTLLGVFVAGTETLWTTLPVG